MQQPQSPHWIDQIVAEVLSWQEKNSIEQLHVDDMKTPSGRVHVGALRGVILHDLVAKALHAQTGKPVVSTYVFNDMDNMDSLPAYLPAEYANHMGRSLHKIPAPPLEQSGIDFSGVSETQKTRYAEAKNMGEFYAFDFIDAFRILGCSQEVVWSHELYESGKMDAVIREALDSIDELKKIYREVADYELPEKWFPFQVICENCGLTGSTLMTEWNGEQVTYRCLEDKVTWAKGCGHIGKISPFGGTGKLLWKVDWPGHWKTLGVNIEGAGKDHTSAGGSRDMADAICERVFKIHTPFDIPYEWILVRGAKMSSSKGVGTSAREFVNALPPAVGRFLFAERHFNQVIDFDPKTMAIPDLFDEYDEGARIFWQQADGDFRLGRSFELSQLREVPATHFLPRFRDVAVWMQHPEINLEDYFAGIKGSSLNELELAELEERKHYARYWVEHYAPVEFQLSPLAELPKEAKILTAEQKAFLQDLNILINSKTDWQPLDLQQQLFDLAKSSVGSKAAFQAIYLAFLGKTAGPKAAWFLLSIAPELRNRRVAELATGAENITSHRFANLEDKQYVSISPEVQQKFPSITLGFAIIRGVSITKTSPDLEAEKAQLFQDLQGITNDSISAHPEVQSYRKLYKETGIDWHSRRPSPEALLRRISQGKTLYTVNTCVDAYNLAVIRNRVSVGAFDLAQIQFPTTLQSAQGGEQILLLGDSESTTLKVGEISYFDQVGPYNLDFNYRDAQRTMVTEATTDLVINVDGVYDISRDQVEQTLQDAIDLITKYCGGRVEQVGIVSAKLYESITPQNVQETSRVAKMKGSMSVPPREEAEKLLQEYIENTALLHHCRMVAAAMEASAKALGEDSELWYQTGLLHDLDWEMYPDEHPNKAITEILVTYPEEMKQAIAAHAPDRTGKQPETTIEKYLFATDELSGLMHAVSLMRPNRFADMEAKSVKKKIKDASFAANVSRDDIARGFELIGKTPDEYIGFLITVFRQI